MTPDEEEYQLQPTEMEKLQTQIAKEKMDRYLQRGVPLENTYLQRTTGYQAKDGKLELVSSRVLDAQGNVKTDASQAIAGNTRGLGFLNQGANPNSGMGRMGNLGQAGAYLTQAANAETAAKTEQQNNWLRSMQTAVDMGKNQERSALQGIQGVGQLQADAERQRASNAYQQGQENKYLLGTGLMAGTSYLLRDAPTGKGQLDGFLTKKFTGQSTPLQGYLNQSFKFDGWL